MAEENFTILQWFVVSDLKIVGICWGSNSVQYEIWNNYVEAARKFSVSFTFVAVRAELLVVWPCISLMKLFEMPTWCNKVVLLKYS